MNKQVQLQSAYTREIWMHLIYMYTTGKNMEYLHWNLTFWFAGNGLAQNTMDLMQLPRVVSWARMQLPSFEIKDTS